MTADPLDPAEDDRFTCDVGEIRIDRVADGQVCFVQWTGAAETGAPTRMPLDVWRASAAKYGLVAKEPQS